MIRRLYSHLKTSVLNGRTTSQYCYEAFKLSLFLALWVVLTMLINYLPRPPFFLSKLLLRLDTYWFDINEWPLGSVSFVLCIFLGTWALYKWFFYTPHWVKYEQDDQDTGLDSHDTMRMSYSPDSLLIPPQSNSFELDPDVVDLMLNIKEPYQNMHNDRLVGKLRNVGSYEPYKCWDLVPLFLLLSSWFLLNLMNANTHPTYKIKNIFAAAFYDGCYVVAPLIVGNWLYFFQAPGTLSLATISFGLLNLLAFFTLLVVPVASPTFLHIFGLTKDPSYDLIFADAMTMKNLTTGLFFDRLVYYLTPGKFASFPSLHVTSSSLTLFLVCYYSSKKSFKLLALINLLGQWWSSIYLKHNWRLDMFVGLLFAVTTWIWIKTKLLENEERVCKLRLENDFKNSSTMGMRLFKDTRFQTLFDPYA